MTRTTLALLAGVATLGFVSSSYAADLIVESPVVPGIVETAGNWDGPFIGVFAGAGWGEADHQPQGPGPFPPGGNDLDLSGWLLGVNAGVNFTLTEGIVAGIVGDIAWADINGSDDTLFGAPTHTIDWAGSVRGRLGFDGGAFLPYLTAGLAFAHGTRTSEAFGGQEADATHIGWTVGAGVEFAVADNLSLDLLYRFSDYGAEEYDFGNPVNPSVELTTHTISLGLNWRF